VHGRIDVDDNGNENEPKKKNETNTHRHTKFFLTLGNKEKIGFATTEFASLAFFVVKRHFHLQFFFLCLSFFFLFKVFLFLLDWS